MGNHACRSVCKSHPPDNTTQLFRLPFSAEGSEPTPNRHEIARKSREVDYTDILLLASVEEGLQVDARTCI